MEINVVINGENKSLNIEAGDYLSEILRENGYKSVKRACEKSSCGSCSVIIENKVVLSCSYLAIRAEGKNIETVEGLQEEAKIIGEQLVNRGGDQCGYCNPGLVITAVQMKRDFSKNIEKVTKEDITHYINGNLCRCSGYIAQLEGMMSYMGVSE